MAIVINGSGTVTGLAVGGLPDGTVDAGTVAADVATQAEIDAKLNLAGGTLTGDLNFGDNVDANFGAGGDLKIYHDGNRSYVQDVGTSSLIIDTDGPEVDINSGGNAEFMGRFIKDGAVKLYYDANQKFETTATGVNVTGAIGGATNLGKVLQVVFATTYTQHSSGGGYSDTGLSAEITPSSSSSNVLVIVSQPITWNTGTSTVRYSEIGLFRGTTQIAQARQNWDIHKGSATMTNFVYSINDLDNPGTTSATTYKTRFMVNAGTSDIYAQYGNNSDSQMILMEIAG